MEKKKVGQDSPSPASDKRKALDTAIAQIEKNFGKGTVMRLGDKPEMQVDAIPTGSLALDAALGIGGVPKGRIIEIYGPESSGKTTLALHIVAQAQKKGGEVAFVDAEHALDPDYAAAIGVDIDNMLVSQPDTGEQALEITDALVRSGAVDVVVVDSVAALTPRQEIEGEMGDTFVGLQARLMSQALRKLAGSIAKWGEWVDLAVQLGIIQKSGSWFSMCEERIGQGRDSVKAYLMNNPEVADQVEAQIRENLSKLTGRKPKAAPAPRPEVKAVSVEASDFRDDD